jgi:hypothetical protein
MSKDEFGPDDSAAFIRNTFTEMLSGMGHVSAENFAGGLLEKLIADGFLELNPGCTKEETAGIFAAAFKTIKLKMPANI